MSEKELILKFWKQEHPTTVKVIKALPGSKLDYRPHPRSRSALELVWLMIYEEQCAVEACKTNEIHWDEKLPSLDLKGMLAAYDKAFESLISWLEKADEKGLAKPTKFCVEGQTIMEESLSSMLWLTLMDRIHHRGQLSVYIRPMGGKVPSIYGPSADDMGQ